MFQIYVTGCAGDTTAGKYNTGAPENRPVLADRIYQGMEAAWKATQRQPLGRRRASRGQDAPARPGRRDLTASTR